MLTETKVKKAFTESVSDEFDIDPDDYPDTTAYLNAIPGMAESLIELMNTPVSEFEDWD